MTSPPLTFSGSRRGGRRWLRAVLLLLAVLVTVLALVAASAGLLWLYAWARLGATAVPSLEADEEALGAAAPSAPEGVTTTLVAISDPLDPTVPRGTPLRGPVALVQSGGPRGDDAIVLLLPAQLPVTIDGEGTVPLTEVHELGGLDLLSRAVVDYTEVRVDHAVRASVDALPQLVAAVDGVETCDGAVCTTVDEAEARRRVAAYDELEPGGDSATVVAELAALVGGLASNVDVPSVLRSPLAAKRVVDTVADDVDTDLSLRGAALLEVAATLTSAGEITVVEVPAVRNPASDTIVLLPERAAARFALLREGGTPTPEEIDDRGEVLRAVEVAVLNGTGTDGYAGRLQARLQAEGVRVVGTGNAPGFDTPVTTVAYGPDDPVAEAAAVLLARALEGATLVAAERPLSFQGERVDVVVTGGEDLDDPAED